MEGTDRLRPYEMAVLPLLWSLSLYHLGRWRTAPRRNRVLTAGWTCLALGATLGTPAVRRVVDALIGVNSGTALLVHLLGLTGTAALVEFVREMTGRARGRLSRRNLAALAAGAIVLTTAFALMPRPHGDIDLLTYSRSSWAGYTYWAVLSGYTAYGLLTIARICWIDGRHASPGPARTSLRLMRIATLLGAAYLLHRFGYVTARFAQWPLPDARLITGATQVLLAIMVLLFALAVIWPAHAEHRQKRAAARQADRIAPLWRLLQTATPDVVLPLPADVRRRNPRLRLYRYVIEIRDSALAVETHLGPGHPPAAEAALRAAGFAGPGPAPAVEAVLLRYAVSARLSGREGACGGRSAVPETSDLEAEISWFEEVAAALELPAVVAAAELLHTVPGAPVNGAPG